MDFLPILRPIAYQWFQWMRSTAGGVLIGLKPVPMV
jgi:hypothetical protein